MIDLIKSMKPAFFTIYQNFVWFSMGIFYKKFSARFETISFNFVATLQFLRSFTFSIFLYNYSTSRYGFITNKQVNKKRKKCNGQFLLEDKWVQNYKLPIFQSLDYILA